MYRPKSFRVDSPNTALDFIAKNSFAIVTSTDNGEPKATHCPMHTIDRDNPVELFGHFAKANPQCAAVNGSTIMLCVFAGPHSYISPTWYKSTPAVPTLNYSTVHITGTATAIDDTEMLRENLLTLTQRHDSTPTSTLTESLMPEKFMHGMIKGIVGFRLQISSMQMTCKLSQNRSEEYQWAVIAQLETSINSSHSKRYKN